MDEWKELDSLKIRILIMEPAYSKAPYNGLEQSMRFSLRLAQNFVFHITRLLENGLNY